MRGRRYIISILSYMCVCGWFNKRGRADGGRDGEYNKDTFVFYLTTHINMRVIEETVP